MEKRIDRLSVFVLALLIYLPTSNICNYIRLGAVFAIALLSLTTHGASFTREDVKLPILMAISPLIATGLVFVIEGSVKTELVTHEVIRMLFCSFLLLFVRRLEVKMSTIYKATVLVFLPNFIIQIMQYMQIRSVDNFIRTYYIAEGESIVHLTLTYTTGAGFRSGSILINPNVFMIVPMIALCVFFYRDKKAPNFLNTVLILFAFASGFLTGSRTAFIVMVFILLIYLAKYADAKRKALFSLLLFIAVLLLGVFSVRSFRATQIDSSSISYKVESYRNYLSRTKSVPLYWLTGSLGSTFRYNMDAEIGFLFAWYGIWGMVWYFQYYKGMWTNNRHLPFYPKSVTVACLLTSVTASVLLCMPVISFASVVAFSNIIDD